MAVIAATSKRVSGRYFLRHLELLCYKRCSGAKLGLVVKHKREVIVVAFAWKGDVAKNMHSGSMTKCCWQVMMVIIIVDP